jgi:hypothetical protein
MRSRLAWAEAFRTAGSSRRGRKASRASFSGKSEGRSRPERPRPHGLGTGHDDADGDPARPADVGHHRLDLPEGAEQPVLPGLHPDLGGVLAGERLELELLEEGVGGGAVRLPAPERLEVESDRRVRAQGGEPL